MKMQSICPDIVLEDPREDYKTAVRVEQYRVSRQAIYFAAFPGTRYLPFRAVRQAWAQKAAEQVLALLADGCPDVVLEPERPARKVCEATDG